MSDWLDDKQVGVQLMEAMFLYWVALGASSAAPSSTTSLQPSRFLSTRSSSDVNGSPGNDRAISLRLHVVIEVHIHFFFAAEASADVIRWGEHVPSSPDATEPVVALLFVFHAVVQVELPPLGFSDLTAQEDIVRRGGVARRGVVKVMVVEVVGLLRQRPGGVAALTVRVDGPVVVGARPVLTAAVAGPTEEQAGFVAIVPPVAAAATRCHGVPAAGVPSPLLPAAAGQENGNKGDNQQQSQKGADHSPRHNSCTGRVLQGFCRGGEGLEGGVEKWAEKRKREGVGG